MNRNEPILNPDLRKSAFLLDVDGTIIDIAASPDAVRVPASLREALARLITATDGAVALVSGRMVANLDHLFTPLRLAAIGGHGAELRLLDSGKTQTRAAPQLDPELKRRLNALARNGVAAEDKGVSIDDVQEVSRYVAAMSHGLARLKGGFPLSLRLLREIHAVLMDAGRGSEQTPCEFRTSQNWIGGSRPGNAAFVPPPSYQADFHIHEHIARVGLNYHFGGPVVAKY